MVLTYMEVHLYYTLPVLGVLLYLLKPYHTPDDGLKYKFLSLVAFVTASIWDNYIVYHRAWSYCPTCVVAVIGYVPLEEYMFFLIMTFQTVAFTNMIMRWQLPTFFIKPNTPMIQTLFVRFAPIAGLLAISYKAWKLTVPDTSLFYGCCIVWYAFPVLALLWFGAGEYMLRRPISVLFSILVPSVYLCWVDVIAIGAGTWHISLRTSTGNMVVPNLPVEEFMFFTLINTVLVFGTCAIDRTQAILSLYRRNNDNSNRASQSFFGRIQEMLWVFFIPDQMVNAHVLDDLSTSWSILREASKSFYTASAVFPAPIRQDLGVLYGFCRATDDLFDDENVSIETRKQQLVLVKSFVSDVFHEKPQDIKWDMYRSELPAPCIAAFQSFTKLVHVVEIGAVLELLDGYRWDLERRTVKTQEDLKYYSACVASSVGEMCTRVILSYSDRTYQKGELDWVIQRAREMGLVLQYINIARDIVTDSQELGRCYLPSEWLTETEMGLIASGKARDIGHDRLIELSTRLVDTANKIKIHAGKGIDKLPYHSQGGVRAACNVYASIGKELKAMKNVYPTRAHVKGIKRVKIALCSVYNI